MIFVLQSTMQSTLRWLAISHQAISQVRSPEHRFVAEEDLCEVVGVSTQYKHQDPVLRLQCKRLNHLLLNSNIHLPSVPGTPINVKDAKLMDTGLMNAHRTDKVLVAVVDSIHAEEWDAVAVVVVLHSVVVEETMEISQ